MFYANYIREKIKNLPKYERIEGKSISIGNSLKRPLRNIKIFGESVQQGAPTVEGPVDITNVVNPTIEFCGKNLIGDALEMYPASIGPSSVVDFSKSYAFKSYTPSGYYNPPSSNLGVLWNGEPYTDPATRTWYGLGISVPAKPNTDYCVSFDIEKTVTVYYVVVFYIDGERSKQVTITPGVSFTTPDGVNGMIISFRCGEDRAPYTISNLQLEEGLTSTAYEKYAASQKVYFHGTVLEGIQLRGLKDINGNFVARDEIVVNGKKKTVKLMQRCWEVELDGAENWQVYDSASGFEGFACFQNVLPEKYNRRTPAFCNQCLVDYNAMWLGVDNKYVYWVGKEARKIYDPSLEDKGLANLKEHLKENPLRIVSYYTNPIETDITDTDVGKMLLALHTNKETTKVFLSSESGLGDVQVRYVRK